VGAEFGAISPAVLSDRKPGWEPALYASRLKSVKMNNLGMAPPC
jgi:hypothetical protein